MTRYGLSPLLGSSLRNEMDSLLSSLFEVSPVRSVSRQSTELPVNIYETDELYLLEAEVPGVYEDQIELVARSNELTLTITARNEDLNEGVTLHRKERLDKTRTRMFQFAAEIESDRVEALLKNGVLTVRLPKQPSARAKKIQVTTH